MLLAFATANAAVILVLAAAAGETRLFGATTRVPALWPYALGLTTLGGILVAGALDAPSRRAFLVRHLLLQLAFPIALLLAHMAPEAASRRWAIGYTGLALAFATHAFVALWRIAPTLAPARAARLIGATALVTQLIFVPYMTFRIGPEADEPHYLIVAQSIGADRDLDLTNNYQPRQYRTFYPGRLPDMHAVPIGGAIYPVRDLGLPLVAALPLWLAGRMGVLVLLAAAAALFVAQAYLLLRDLRFSPRVALTAAALGATAHPLITYGTQIYPDVLVALAGVTAVRLARRGPGLAARDAGLAAACIACLPWLTTRASFYAVGLAVCLAVFAGLAVARAAPPLRARRAGTLALAAVPALGIFVALLVVNWSLFGLPIPGAGFYLIREQHVLLSGQPHVGAVGLFFGRVFGIIPRAPIYLLAFLGAFALASRARSSGPLVALLVGGGILHFAFVASLEHWHSDWSPPGRNLVAILPLLIAGVAGGLETLARVGRAQPLVWIPAGLAIGWSGMVALLYCGIPSIRYNLPDALRGTSETGKLWLLIQQTIGLDLGRILPSLTQQGASVLPLAVAWLALAAGLALLGRRWTPAART